MDILILPDVQPTYARETINVTSIINNDQCTNYYCNVGPVKAKTQYGR